jgi:hypothetical protein
VKRLDEDQERALQHAREAPARARLRAYLIATSEKLARRLAGRKRTDDIRLGAIQRVSHKHLRVDGEYLE